MWCRKLLGNRISLGTVDVQADMTIESMRREINEQALTVTKYHYHSDKKVDLVVLETDFESHGFSHEASREGTAMTMSISIPIGSHVDDWIGDQFVLSKVLVMGYP